MSKPTEGEWYYAPQHDAVVVVRDYKVKVVADFGKVDLPEREANAHLIAASKGLLKALEEIAESYPATEEGETLAGIARAAIAKVKGVSA